MPIFPLYDIVVAVSTIGALQGGNAQQYGLHVAPFLSLAVLGIALLDFQSGRKRPYTFPERHDSAVKIFLDGDNVFSNCLKAYF